MSLIKNIIHSIINKLYLKKLNRDLCTNPVNALDNSSHSKIPFHIITVTYNNDALLEHQIKLMRKNIEDEFVFIVADNSTDIVKRKSIENICKNFDIPYIPLPKNPYSTGSRSHGICLNWIVKNYIDVIKPAYFGFIDHDIFPIKKHSILIYLKKQKIYGHMQIREPYWYLWAGFCFFSFDSIKDIPLNFYPANLGNIRVDTGGANWNRLYSKLDNKIMSFPEHSYTSLRDGKVDQSDRMEIIGNWLHSFNGSYWMNVKPKEHELNNYLKKFY